MNVRLLLPVIAPLLLAAASAAQDPTTDGAVELLAQPPSSILPNATESNTRIRLFRERSGEVLSQAVPCDIAGPNAPGEYHQFGNGLPQGFVAAGTPVDVYLLHQDTQGTHALSGSVVFATEILGVIVRSPTLFDSDRLGVPGGATLYPTNGNADRGLENFNSTYDAIELKPDRRTIEIALRTRDDMNNVDEVRILTAAGAPAFRPYCFGSDGCACSNTTTSPVGCRNSTGTGGFVVWTGDASLGDPAEIAFVLGGLPPHAIGMLFVGTAEVALPLPFGDGLLCVSPGPPGPSAAPWDFGLRRFPGQRASAGGTIAYPGVESYLQGQGLALAPGQRLYFQGYYRNPGLASCATPAGFNLTHAVELTFRP